MNIWSVSAPPVGPYYPSGLWNVYDHWAASTPVKSGYTYSGETIYQLYDKCSFNRGFYLLVSHGYPDNISLYKTDVFTGISSLIKSWDYSSIFGGYYSSGWSALKPQCSKDGEEILVTWRYPVGWPTPNTLKNIGYSRSLDGGATWSYGLISNFQFQGTSYTSVHRTPDLANISLYSEIEAPSLLRSGDFGATVTEALLAGDRPYPNNRPKPMSGGYHDCPKVLRIRQAAYPEYLRYLYVLDLITGSVSAQYLVGSQTTNPGGDLLNGRFGCVYLGDTGAPPALLGGTPSDDAPHLLTSSEVVFFSQLSSVLGANYVAQAKAIDCFGLPIDKSLSSESNLLPVFNENGSIGLYPKVVNLSVVDFMIAWEYPDHQFFTDFQRSVETNFRL